MTLILIRGLPGSGKSTLAKRLQANYLDAVHLETDMFFVDTEGQYGFNRSLLGTAHQWCQDTAKILLISGQTVIVSNTFTTVREMQPYLDHAEKLGCEVKVYYLTGNYGNIHNVPEDVIKRMADRFEAYFHETVAQETPDENQVMDICSKPGTKVKYLGKNGYEYQRKRADLFFQVGEILTVCYVDVARSSSEVCFDEYPGIFFNTVMFGKV